MGAVVLQALAEYGPIWALYGGSAAFALWAAWRDPDVRLVASVLLLSFVASNLVWFLADPHYRPGVYTALQVVLATVAYTAWLCRTETSSRVRQWGLVGVVALSLAYVCVNVVFALTYQSGDIKQLNQHEITTNLIYLGECLVTAGIGVVDGLRSGRFSWWSSLHHAPAVEDARLKEGGE